MPGARRQGISTAFATRPLTRPLPGWWAAWDCSPSRPSRNGAT